MTSQTPINWKARARAYAFLRLYSYREEAWNPYYVTIKEGVAFKKVDAATWRRFNSWVRAWPPKDFIDGSR